MNLQITVGSFCVTSLHQTKQYLITTVDLNALAWLEDYLQTWPGTLLVVYVLWYFSWRYETDIGSLSQVSRSCFLVSIIFQVYDISLTSVLGTLLQPILYINIPDV